MEWTPTALAQYDTSKNQWKRGAGDQYDGAGNQTALASDQAPNFVSSTFTFDAENRMVTSNVANTGAVTYQYDGDGHRVKKVAGAVTTTYVYDAFGSLAQEYSNLAPAAGGTQYLTADALVSTRLITDSSGTMKRYDYLPFGEDIVQGKGGRGSEYPTAASLMFPSVPDAASMKFTSKERDPETGLDFFGARYMSSAQGRFTSPDPDNYDARIDQPQAWNMYAYTWNNPLKYKDDDGRAVNLALAGIGAGVGFVTGFGGSAISQYVQSGSVDWGKATAYGAGGAAAGSLAGLTFGGSLVAQALAGAAVGTVGNVANGVISRGLAGEEAFDEDAMESDLAYGAIGGTIGAGIQFVGTVVKLPVAPKAPNPLGTVRTQLARMAKLRAWQAQRESLNNTVSAVGGTVGAIYTNTFVQVKTSYDIRQSLTAFGYLDQSTSAAQRPKEKVTSKVCFTDENGKKVCQ